MYSTVLPKQFIYFFSFFLLGESVEKGVGGRGRASVTVVLMQLQLQMCSHLYSTTEKCALSEKKKGGGVDI